MKPAVQYGFLLLGGVLLVTGGVALFTWMADSERITQTPEMPEKSGGGTVPQEEVASTVQQGEPPSEIVESSGTPVATTEAPSTAIENGVAIANADGSSAQGSSAQAGCAPGVPPEATAGGGVVPDAECTKPALPLPAPTPAPPPPAPPPPSPTPSPPAPAKALPPAGGVDIASLLGVGTGILLVGSGLLAGRFIR